MKTIQFFFIVAFSFLMAACVSSPQKEVVTQYQDRIVDIPSSLLQPCPTTQPPDKAVYLQSTASKREELITNYSINLIKDVKNCNDQLKSISDLQVKERNIITPPVQKSTADKITDTLETKLK